MSTQSYKFPATIPIDITFFNAESVSPTKLNNIFNYIKNATYSIEMFLGNGIDYNTTIEANKKIIGNISNIIGQTAGSIYKPFNRIDFLYALYKKYCSTYSDVGNKKYNNYQNANYIADDHLEIVDSVNIPVMRSFKHDIIIGVHYTVKSNITSISNSVSCTVYYSATPTQYGDNQNDHSGAIVEDTSQVMAYNEEIPHHASVIIPANTFIKYINFNNNNSTIYKYNIYSLYLTEKANDLDEDNLRTFNIPAWSQPQQISYQFYADSGNEVDNPFVPLNQFYSIGLDHSSYIACIKPCKWSKGSYNSLGVQCDKCTVEGACIGNTYDIYIDNGDNLNIKTGIPVCAGTYRAQSSSFLIYGDLLPTDGTPTILQYNNSYDGTENPQFFVMQSPLSTYKNKFGTFKFHPFLLTTQTDSQAIAQGRVMIYDALADDGNHIIWDAKSISTFRPDIIKVISNKITSGNYKKYLVLSGDVGISDMNKSVVNESNEKVEKHIAVYSD